MKQLLLLTCSFLRNGHKYPGKKKSVKVSLFLHRDLTLLVLGQIRIIRGRSYWKVEVWDRDSWDLGVCRDNVIRKGRVNVSPRCGFWCIRLYDGEYWGLSNSEMQLTLKENPHHVGIFLDVEERDLYFYNLKDKSHISHFQSFHSLASWDHILGFGSVSQVPWLLYKLKRTDWLIYILLLPTEISMLGYNIITIIPAS